MTNNFSKGDIILKPDGNRITRQSLLADAISYYQEKYQQNLTDVCDFSEGSEIRTLHESFLVELFSLYREMFRTAKMKFVLDSEGEYLDRLGCEYHLRRQTGKQAMGSVTFSAKDLRSGNITIPQGTIILNRKTGYEYRLDHNVTITGTSTPTNGTVHSVYEGSQYNAKANELTAFEDVSTFNRTVNVTNNGPITGGLDKENDADFRTRILNAKREKSWGTVPVYSNLIRNAINSYNINNEDLSNMGLVYGTFQYGVHDVQFIDPKFLMEDEKRPPHYKDGTKWEDLVNASFDDRKKHYCTDCSRVLFVNGNMKPCSDELLKNVEYVISQQNNLVIGHNFHVQAAEIIPVYLSIEMFCSVHVTEDTVYRHLACFFNGGTVEGKSGSVNYGGVNIGETIPKSYLLDVLENIPGVEQVGSIHRLKYDNTLDQYNNWIDNVDNTYTYTDDEGYNFTRGTKAEDTINFWGWTNFSNLTCECGQVFTVGSKKEADKHSENMFDLDIHILKG